MKHLLFFFLLCFSFSCLAQYPANPRKQLLGVQTTGQGLVYVKDGAPAHTPADVDDTWMVLDTTNNKLYYYDETANAWDTIAGTWLQTELNAGSVVIDGSGNNLVFNNLTNFSVTADGIVQINKQDTIGYLLITAPDDQIRMESKDVQISADTAVNITTDTGDINVDAFVGDLYLDASDDVVISEGVVTVDKTTSRVGLNVSSPQYTLDILNGGLRLGGQSSPPPGAAGVRYFDSDDNRDLLHDGTDYDYYAMSEVANFTQNAIAIGSSEGTLTEDPTDIYWDGNTLFLNREGQSIDFIDIQAPVEAGAAISIGSNRTPIYEESGAIQIGDNSNAADDRNIAIGQNAAATQIGTIAVGANSDADGTSVAVGDGAQATANNTNVIGRGSSATDVNAITIGSGSSNAGQNTILIGFASTTTAAADHSIILGQRSIAQTPNTFIAGSGGTGNGTPITQVYFGSGVRSGASDSGYNPSSGVATDYTINGSGAPNVTNGVGGNITIAGGKGTGTGTPGAVIISTSNTTGSGTTLQTLSERARFTSTGLGINTTPTLSLDINGAARIRSNGILLDPQSAAPASSEGNIYKDSDDEYFYGNDGSTHRAFAYRDEVFERAYAELYTEIAIGPGDTINLDTASTRTIIFESQGINHNFTLTDSTLVPSLDGDYHLTGKIQYGWTGTLPTGSCQNTSFGIYIDDVFQADGSASGNFRYHTDGNAHYIVPIDKRLSLSQGDVIKLKATGGCNDHKIFIIRATFGLERIGEP